MRFYELTDGCIKIDGVPTTDIQREDVQRLFGMVLQETWLFDGTGPAKNLVYNLPGVTDAQIETVCRACGLDKFVHSPEGFDTVLSESTSISAGQKQLLTIAAPCCRTRPCSSSTRRRAPSTRAPSFSSSARWIS